MAQARIFPPDRADDGRGSYEMVDILAIASGWSTVAVRETLQRDRAVQSPYIRCYENPPCRVPCWSSGARYRERARRFNEREYPRPRLAAPAGHPTPHEPPRVR